MRAVSRQSRALTLVEVKVGFEPTIVEICSHLPWVTRPPRDYDTLANVGIKAYLVPHLMESR